MKTVQKIKEVKTEEVISGNDTPQVTTGSISVSSTPSGASIYLDSSYQSTTPYTINNVQAGSHTITLKLNDYEDWSTSVNVVAGQTTTVSKSLIQKTPQKYVLGLYVYDSKTNERLEGAKVYVDNSLKATIDRYGSPDPNVYLLPGTYSIRISKDGCTDESFSVAIPMKETSYVAMNCKTQQNQQPTIVSVTYSKPVEAGSQPSETRGYPSKAVSKPNDELMSKNSAIRANIYANLVDQWQKPEGKLLKRIIDPLFEEIFLDSIRAFIPDNTYTDLISSISDLKDEVEEARKEKPGWAWWLTEEETNRLVAMQDDYNFNLNVPYELQTKEVPLHSTLREMKDLTQKESDAWKSKSCKYIVFDCRSNPENAKNILKNEGENINDLKKILSWSIEMEKSAETDEYKTLIKLTNDFLSEEIDYLQSID